MSVPIGCGQTLPPPVTLALMAQMLDVQPDQKVLLVGSGSGYLAGVLSQMTTRIYAVERYLTLIGSSWAMACAQNQKAYSNSSHRRGDCWAWWMKS
jgi:protein-L-isoaspartate(D-aspartate) O-methyltransferase